MSGAGTVGADGAEEIPGRMVAAEVDTVLSPTPLADLSDRGAGREAAHLEPNGVRVILIEP